MLTQVDPDSRELIISKEVSLLLMEVKVSLMMEDMSSVIMFFLDCLREVLRSFGRFSLRKPETSCPTAP